jgi:hypothetical protein
VWAFFAARMARFRCEGAAAPGSATGAHLVLGVRKVGSEIGDQLGTWTAQCEAANIVCWQMPFASSRGYGSLKLQWPPC